MKIIGIAGSPRKQGNSTILLEHVLEGAAEKDVAWPLKEILTGNRNFWNRQRS